MKRYTGLIERYRKRLPVADDARIITLGEGSTPLIRLENISEANAREIGLYVKYEGLNPTGSFKDRGMTMAITQAVNEGSQAVLCASTGNTSASAAAYAARAGMVAYVLIPDGKIAMGKLAQAMMHGAVVIQIEGNFDDGMRLVKEVAAEAPVTIVNSINPYRLQGQKTAAFEIMDELGAPPDFHCLPVGNAGNISAYWTGYNEYAGMTTRACNFCDGQCPYQSLPIVDKLPRMLGYQAAGAAPFLRGEMVKEPETVASAIRIGQPNRGTWPGRQAGSPKAGSTNSVTRKSWPHRRCWPAGKAYFANPLQPYRLPAPCAISKQEESRKGAQSCAP